MIEVLDVARCSKCKHKWIVRKGDAKQCPSCHRKGTNNITRYDVELTIKQKEGD